MNAFKTGIDEEAFNKMEILKIQNKSLLSLHQYTLIGPPVMILIGYGLNTMLGKQLSIELLIFAVVVFTFIFVVRSYFF